jgi:hypothetical protein
MDAEQHRYKGRAVNGKIELEAGASVPEGAEVTVLFQEADALSSSTPRGATPAPKRASTLVREMARKAVESDDAGLTEPFPA